MRKNLFIENWQMAYLENAKVNQENIVLTTPEEVKASNYPIIKASVPGNYEIDFMREGLLDDVYMGTNSIKTQRLENLHFTILPSLIILLMKIAMHFYCLRA